MTDEHDGMHVFDGHVPCDGDPIECLVQAMEGEIAHLREVERTLRETLALWVNVRAISGQNPYPPHDPSTTAERIAWDQGYYAAAVLRLAAADMAAGNPLLHQAIAEDEHLYGHLDGSADDR